MKRPITRSCIVVVLEKQIVRRTSRLIRVRKLICLLSISGGQIPRSLLRLLDAVIVARMSEYIHQSHNVSVLMYHLVCPTQYRRVVFDARVDTVLKAVCLDIAKR